MGEMFAVPRTQHRLLDSRISADVTNRRHDERQALVLQRAQRDLDHDLAAVLALGHEFHLRPHGPGAWRARVGLAIGRMARANAVGHQDVDIQSHDLVRPVSQQQRCGRVG